MKGFDGKSTFKMANYDIAGYYPYTSIVTYRILSMNHNYETDFDDVLKGFWKEITDALQEIEPDLFIDNKVVVELKPKEIKNLFFKGSNLFVGCYDGIVSLGMGVWQPDDWTKKDNRVYQDGKRIVSDSE